MGGSNDGAASSAEVLFAEYLALVGSGDPVDFDAICREYRDQAADLRRLKAARDALHERLLEARPRVEDVPHVSVIERLQQEFGSAVDPGKSIQESGPSGSAFAKELVTHLGQRSGSFGRYTVEEEIGRGGMGRVLRVWDKDLRRWLAMKLVRTRRTGGPPKAEGEVGTRTLGRFLEEAQVTSQLDHPGIVPVHELGLDSEGRVYFTMKLVEGRTLQAVFEELAREEGSWTQTGVLGLILKVCEAMSYAHDKGVIHRDLKPSNVMVGLFGEVYVMDWGLARVLNRGDRKALHPPAPTSEASGATSLSYESPLTMDGDVLGTPAFMPPEQARGEIDRLDKRADVYALGAMLYQLLTGQVPYVGEEERPPWRALVARVLAGPPPSIASLGRNQPAELVAICDMAMARDPADRYSDMVALAADLRAYLEGRVVRAHRTGALAEFGKWVSRNRGMAASLGAAALLALGGMAAIAVVQARGKQRELAGKQRELIRSYVANLRAAESSLQASECTDARLRLEETDKNLRGWEWDHLQLASDLSVASLDLGSLIRSVAFTPDGRLFLGCRDGSVRLWEPPALARELGRNGYVYGVAVSADGRLAATGGDDNFLKVWDAHSGQCLKEKLEGHSRGLTCVAFSPDSAWIASGSDDNTIRLWDTVKFGSRLLGGHAAFVTCVAFDHTGARLASGGGDSTVRIWSVPDGELLHELHRHSAAVRSLAFSPDGRRLATASDDGLIRTWDAQTMEPLLIFRGHSAGVRSVAYGPDGTWLVSGSEDGTVRTWNAGTAEPLTVQHGHDGKVYSVACSADGQVIASGSSDGTVRLWNPRARDCCRIADSEVTSVGFGNDGSRLIAVSGNVVRIRDSVRGDLLPTSGAVRIKATYAALTSGGTLIVSSIPQRLVQIRSASTGDVLQNLDHGPRFALAKDSTLLVTATKEGEVRIWALAQGTNVSATTLRDLPVQAGQVFALAIDPSCSRIAVGLLGEIDLFDMQSGHKLAQFVHNGSVDALAFDPTGRLLASGADNHKIRVWDTATGQYLQELGGHTSGVSALAWDAKGSRLVSCSEDGTVRVWGAFQDARLFETVAILRGQEEHFRCLAFSPDGTRLACGAQEGIRIWETVRIAEGTWSDNTTRTAADLLAEAEVGSENASELNTSVWQVVRIPGNSALAYERALRRAERAEELDAAIKASAPPSYVPPPLLLRAAAQYRIGELELARELLTQALETYGDNPVVLAFLAMTHHRLSDAEQARVFFTRLQQLMAARPAEWDWGGQLDLRDLACEAGVLVGR